MQTEIIMFYVICDNLLKKMNLLENIQAKMDNAKVMAVVLTAACFFAAISGMRRIFSENTVIS
jgi:hypothetical protein